MDQLNAKFDTNRRLELVLLYLGYAAFSIYIAGPVDWAGVVITLGTIFPILLAIPVLWVKWAGSFHRNRALIFVAVVLVLGILWLATGVLIPALSSYIGVHFA